jgi:hypothetical protein
MIEKDKIMFKKWREARLKEGWIGFHRFVPGPLAIELREFVRTWKYNNPQHYTK